MQQSDTHGFWSSFQATLAQNNNQGANPVFNQANPGAGSPTNTAAPGAGGTTTAPAPTGGGGAPQGSPFGGIFIPLMVMMGAIILFSFLSNRKQDKKRRQLLNAVKKYDKVVTLGGIIGTVVELRDDEVVLKVDEHSSTKIRFTRSAIQQVLRPPGESETAKGGEEIAESKSKGESVGAKG
jgi:preprotein translocase subunit YajC